jgi:ubiquinone/menaquinone biosynthesis C-methylase UbiE
MDADQEYANQFYALTYDSVVKDWPGEIDFYRDMALTAHASGQKVLEIASGTGRIAIRLAQAGVDITGLDRSPYMLTVAQGKSAGMENIRWVQTDMRAFDLKETFGLALIPGHSFQNLNTPNDQAACLTAIRRHLVPGGVLVVHLDHQDPAWLGVLNGAFEPADEFTHPQSGRLVRAYNAWDYERATQTAVLITRWEEVDQLGQVVDVIERGPLRLHCLFRFEMEHLLARAGFEVEALYGDFTRAALDEDSSEMIWVARRPLG